MRAGTRTTAVLAAVLVLAAAAPARGGAGAADPAPGTLVRIGDLAALAPPPGTGVFAEAIIPGRPHQTLQLETDVRGVVRVLDVHDGALDRVNPLYNEAIDVVQEFTACVNDPYTHRGWREGKRHRWRFNSGSTPAYLNAADVRDALIRGTEDVTETRNSCQMPKQVSTSHLYEGSTTGGVNINNSGACGNSDGSSVVAFGTLPDYFLANACVWYSTSSKPYPVLESDIKFNKRDFTWFTVRPIGCDYEFDVESVMAHERGHTFGLGHVSDPSMTMAQYIRPCSTSKRTLGRGDVAGLDALYA